MTRHAGIDALQPTAFVASRFRVPHGPGTRRSRGRGGGGGQMNRVKVLNWNLQWLTPKASRYQAVKELFGRLDPDVMVVTEACAVVLPDVRNVITSRADYGYASAPEERRKVLLWSRNGWSDVDDFGAESLPGGRFVAGTTNSPLGPIRVFGVCIPWRDAHVRTGRRDRAPWHDHLQYLDALPACIHSSARPVPTVIAGDFNQRIPAARSPQRVSTSLRAAFSDWNIITSGLRSKSGELLIDHVGVRPPLTAGTVEVIERIPRNGRPLSDHHGVVVELTEIGNAERARIELSGSLRI